MARQAVKQSQAMKIIGYIRASTPGQVQDGETLERQREQILCYCKLKGLPEPEIIADEGVSGFKSARDGFQRLIQLCKSGQAKTVIVYDLSRLSRSVRDTLEFIEDTIHLNGVEFVSLQNDIDTSTPTGKAFLTISAVFNQLYRDEISHKTTAAMQHKKSKQEKTGGTVPFGYSLVDGMKLVPEAGELQTVRFMHELRQQGCSLTEIVRELYSAGIKTKTGREVWSVQVVKDILERQVQEVCNNPELSCEQVDTILPEVLEAIEITEKSPQAWHQG